MQMYRIGELRRQQVHSRLACAFMMLAARSQSLGEKVGVTARRMLGCDLTSSGSAGRRAHVIHSPEHLVLCLVRGIPEHALLACDIDRWRLARSIFGAFRVANDDRAGERGMMWIIGEAALTR